MNSFICLDTSVFLKWLSPESEEFSPQAISLIEQSQAAIIVPAFAWAEVGSALRKKVRMGAMSEVEMEQAWRAFLNLGVHFLNTDALAERAWQIAAERSLPTLYDAAFLATAELAPDGPCPFWTADEQLVGALAQKKPYVRRLAAYPEG